MAIFSFGRRVGYDGNGAMGGQKAKNLLGKESSGFFLSLSQVVVG